MWAFCEEVPEILQLHRTAVFFFFDPALDIFVPSTTASLGLSEPRREIIKPQVSQAREMCLRQREILLAGLSGNMFFLAEQLLCLEGASASEGIPALCLINTALMSLPPKIQVGELESGRQCS